MTPEGFDCWKRTMPLRQELASGGEYADIRDCASKAGENLARIAALFHLFERGLTGALNSVMFTPQAPLSFGICGKRGAAWERWHFQKSHAMP